MIILWGNQEILYVVSFCKEYPSKYGAFKIETAVDPGGALIFNVFSS